MRIFSALLPLVVLGAGATAHAQAAATRSFAIGAFDAVALEGADEVRVVPGPRVSVVASGSPAVLDRLRIRVEGGTLKIGRERGSWSWGRSRGAVVTVTTPGVRGAALSGSGDMSVSALRGPAVALEVSGSGVLRARGAADSAKLALSGSGGIDATQLASRRTQVSVGGSGDVRARASVAATISLSGSGNVTISGTDRCTISKSGSGAVRCVR